MEEKTISFLILDWKRVPETATNKLNNTITSQFCNCNFLKIYKGSNFCQLLRTRNIIQFKSMLSLKNQKWKGGKPIFHIILIKKNSLKKALEFLI